MRVKKYNNRVRIFNTRLKYNYPNESKAYVDVIQADVALTADQRLYAHFMIGIDINELLWVLRKAIYLYLGGTASTHKWNAKDLRDLDEAFRLQYLGTVNHSSLGMQSSTGGYANTHLTPSIDLTSIQNVALSVYITAFVTPTNFVEAGVTVGDNNRFAIRGAFETTNKTASASIGPVNPLTDTYSANEFIKKGFILSSRTSPTVHKIFVDILLSGITTVSNAGALPNAKYYILCYNNNGVVTAPSKNTHGYDSILNSGLTDQQAITDSKKTIFGQKIINRA